MREVSDGTGCAMRGAGDNLSVIVAEPNDKGVSVRDLLPNSSCEPCSALVITKFAPGPRCARCRGIILGDGKVEYEALVDSPVCDG